MHLQAFGTRVEDSEDIEDYRRAWRAVERFQLAAWVLLASSIASAGLAIWRFLRPKRDGSA